MPHPLSSEISQQETWCINGITYPEGYEAEQASPGTTLPAVTSIARPDGTAYTFQYDPTYGTISQITFPDGGYVKFVWGILANVGGYGQFGAISSIAVTEVITAAASGASESIWQYNISPFAAGQPLSSSVIAPDGSYTNYTGIYMSPYSLLIGSQRSRRDLLIEGKLPARNRRLRVVERELPQGFDMGWIGNGCSCFRRRGMFSDDHTFDTDNDPMISITDEDCLSGVFRGQRVAALLKAHEAIETGLARKHLLQRIRRNAVECRQPFASPEMERALAGRCVDARVGRVREPVTRLRVEVCEIAEVAPGKEVVLDVMDHAFHLALGARPANAMCLGRETIVVGEISEQRVQFGWREPHLLRVVVEDFLRPAAEELESVAMTAKQRGQSHRSGKLDKKHPRKSQHHDEGIDWNHRSLDIRKAAAVAFASPKYRPIVKSNT